MPRTIPLFVIAMLLAGTASGSELGPPRHLEEAIRDQMRRTSRQPSDARAFNDLGNLLILAGDSERAEEAYRRSIEIEPDNPMAHYNLGLLLRQTGRVKPALRALQRVVELDPGDAWGHFQLGILLEQRDKNQKAVSHLSEAFLLDPQLAHLEVNPQLLDSRLVTRALTVAYTERVARLESAPRQYRQPKRITRLLVPETKPSAPAAEGVEPEAGEPEAEPQRPKERRKRKSEPPGDS